ncbi:riboflavin synthase [Methylohalomonas lacus]|uniref:Riboflavin synthase n=1 Tax=Methylohalomonas lacus TaxID=398773 RepID=A0AAE3L0D5_9GAMM|nr:riboflavin synthase [Methylohalomonas lacus]MCS3902304.1 riboflavin synthase [Methylohalomonas lacus]
MFTGIVESIGRIIELDSRAEDARLIIDTADLELADMALGDSLAVSGVCLSLVEKHDRSVVVDVSAETLRCTTLRDLHRDSRVNLERALQLGERLGGHLVSGHVDGVGTVVSRDPVGESLQLQIQAPRALARYIAVKGSICVDGVSLTVNTVSGAEFSVNLIQHTQAVTTLGALERGASVNLEADMIARYLERLLGER